MEDGGYIFKFTPAGELDISTEFMKVGSGYPIQEYYYYTDDMQYKRISPPSVVGFNFQNKEDVERGDYETHQSYQFVGSSEEYQKYRDQFSDKNDNPIVGLVKKDQLQSH
jgi:hypothetical protein